MTENAYVRRRASKFSKTDDSAEQKVEYSEEQLEAVQRVRSCKDYYEILGITKEAGDSELRKQYKKLALQFHPDKNKAPGAVEAFKAIGNAFAVLSDPEKRKQYDTFGLEGAQRMHRHTENGDRPGFAAAFEGDINPEDLFNMFFNTGFADSTTFIRRGNTWQPYTPRPNHAHHQHRYHRNDDARGVLLQIMPLVILVTISLLSNLFVSEPLYNLSRTSKYIVERRTQNLEVPYYVKENFISDYKGRIPHIEKEVEEEYLMGMRSACYRERNYKESMIFRAKTFRDMALVDKAQKLRTPSCDVLNELYSNMHRLY